MTCKIFLCKELAPKNITVIAWKKGTCHMEWPKINEQRWFDEKFICECSHLLFKYHFLIFGSWCIELSRKNIILRAYQKWGLRQGIDQNFKNGRVGGSNYPFLKIAIPFMTFYYWINKEWSLILNIKGLLWPQNIWANT